MEKSYTPLAEVITRIYTFTLYLSLRSNNIRYKHPENTTNAKNAQLNDKGRQLLFPNAPPIQIFTIPVTVAMATLANVRKCDTPMSTDSSSFALKNIGSSHNANGLP